jgi:hypothetical protein
MVVGMPKISAAAAAQKWQQNTSASLQTWTANSNSTSKDPTQLAANAAQKWFTNVQSAYNLGLFQAGLARSGKSGWLAGINGKGQTNFVGGVNGSEQKVAGVFNALFQYEAGLQNQIDTMPDNTPADAEARMLAWTRGMRAFRGQAR